MNRFILLLALPSLYACDAEPEVDVGGLASELAATDLCDLFDRASAPCEVTGTTAKGPSSIDVAARQLGVITKGGVVLVDVAIDLTVDGTPRPELTCTAVGYGPTPEASTTTAITEWQDRCGTAIVDALVDSGQSSALGERNLKSELLRLTVGNHRAYPGKTLMKGQLEGGPTGNHPMLLSFIEPALGSIASDTPHFLQIELTMSGAMASEARCLIDGEESVDLCKAARDYPWPKGDPKYVVKQTYALTPAPQGKPADDPAPSPR